MAGEAVATLLQRRKTDLIERWTRRVLEDDAVPRANALERPVLEDHVPRLIDQLVEALRQPHPRHTGEAHGHAVGASDDASKHARVRFEAGYSTAEALRELAHFRAALLALLAEEGASVGPEETQLIHSSIDGAVSTIAAEMERSARAAHEEQLAFRDRFIGILGHDLRTPLGAITFNAAWLQQDEACAQSQSKAIRRIIASADRMGRMIADLLDVTRTLHGGSIPIRPRPADMCDNCLSVIAELEGYRPSTLIQVEAEGSTAGVWDVDRVAQMLSNLITNAIDYSPPSTPVRVTIRGRERDVEVEVHNEGPPIPEQTMATLFDPFNRGPQDGRRSGRSGLGLGLFIAREVAEAHGGSLDVTSRAGEGTTFTARLPRSG